MAVVQQSALPLDNHLILANIFQFLDRTNLNNCRLTCQKLREESLPIFREKVCLVLSHLTRGGRTYSWKNNDLHMNFWGCNPDLFQNTEITSSFCNSVRSMTAQKFIMKPFPINNGISFRFCDHVRDLRLDGEALCGLISCFNDGSLKFLEAVSVQEDANAQTRPVIIGALPMLKHILIISHKPKEIPNPIYQRLIDAAPNLEKLSTDTFLNIQYKTKLKALVLFNASDPKVLEMITMVCKTLEYLYLRKGNVSITNTPLCKNLKQIDIGELDAWRSPNPLDQQLAKFCPNLETLTWFYPMAFIESSPKFLKKIELPCCRADGDSKFDCNHDWILPFCSHLSRHYPTLKLLVMTKNCELEDGIFHEETNDYPRFMWTVRLFGEIINVDVENVILKTGQGHKMTDLVHILNKISVSAREEPRGSIEIHTRFTHCCAQDGNYKEQDSERDRFINVVRKLGTRYKKVVVKYFELSQNWIEWINQKIAEDSLPLEIYGLPAPGLTPSLKQCQQMRSPIATIKQPKGNPTQNS